MKSGSKNAVVGFVVAVIGIIFYGALGAGTLPYARHHDFLAFYTGAKLVWDGHTSQLYDLAIQRSTEKTLAPDAPVTMPFIRPPFYAAALAPLAALPLEAAFVVWVGLQIAGLLGFWWWAYRRFGPDALVYCALFMPTARGILHGQDCVAILLLMLAAYLAFERGRDQLSGALIGLMGFKFHLLLLLPVAMLARRRWRMFGAYSAVSLALAAISLIMIGLPGLKQYISLLTRSDLDSLNPSPEMMVNIHSIAANLAIDAVWFKPMLVIAIVLLAVTATRNWFWAAALGSLLLPPHTYVYDLAILLIPGLMAVFDDPKLPRVVAAVALVPIPYLFTFFQRPLAVIPSLVVAAMMLALTMRSSLGYQTPRCETIAASP